MEGLREEIDRRDGDRLEDADLAEASEVAGEGRRVAAHVGDGAGGLIRELRHDIVRETGAGRIDDDDVRVVIRELAACVSTYGVDVVEASLLEVAAEIAYGGTIGLNGVDEVAPLGER